MSTTITMSMTSPQTSLGHFSWLFVNSKKHKDVSNCSHRRAACDFVGVEVGAGIGHVAQQAQLLRVKSHALLGKMG